MKLTIFLLTAAFLHVSAKSVSQHITFSGKDVPLKIIFAVIKQQTGFFVLSKKDLLERAKPVSVSAHQLPLKEFLELVLKDQSLSFRISDKTIMISRKSPPSNESSDANSREVINSQDQSPPIDVTGRVVDENGQPVSGASVTVKGSRRGTSTNGNGEFELSNVNEDAVLIISGINIQPYEISVTNSPRLKSGANGSALFSISVKQAIKEEDEVVVAYNKTTMQKNVTALTVVKGEQIKDLPTRSIDRSLQGMVPGLQITSGTGQPGGNVGNITLRGIATGGYGLARNPLYVVDGTIVSQEGFDMTRTSAIDPPDNMVRRTNPLSQINPNDIESITVLKDAAAIALYGSQASNGVILITTKKGKAGKVKINFQHQTDIAAKADDKREVLNQQQYLALLYEAYKNADPVAWTDETILNDLRSKFPYRAVNGDTSFYAAANWDGELYSNAAVTVLNDLSLSGGTEKITYYLGLGQLNQKGILKNTSFDRYSLRYNVDIKAAPWIKFGINTSLAYTHQDLGGLGESMTSINGFGNYASPLLPVRKENGTYQLFYPEGAGGFYIPNPVALAAYNSTTAKAYRVMGNAFAEINFLQYFSFKTNVGIDMLSAQSTDITDKRTVFWGTGGELRKVGELRTNTIINNILRFNRPLNDHHNIGVLLGQEAQVQQADQVTAIGSNITSAISENDISAAPLKSSQGIVTKSTFLSYFGQVNYDYRQKYLASVGLRLDGSSRFGKDVPLKGFWSFGAGWVVSEENFMSSAKRWMNYLKFRGSIGVAGNSIAIPTSTRQDRATGIFYNNQSTYGPTIEILPANPDIEPESTFNTDIGIEGQLFNNRIGFTADVYQRKTKNLVSSLPQPFTAGQVNVYRNLGDMENKGIELSLTAEIIRNKNVSWTISGNWSTNQNKFVKFYDSASYELYFINRVGSNYNSWYLVPWAGVDAATGNPQWLDKDGKITNSWDFNNRVEAGKPQPSGFGAINTSVRYRSLTVTAFFYYTYGYKIYNSYLSQMLTDGAGMPYNNQSVQALDRWQKPGDIAANPKRVLNNSSWSNFQSTRYLSDGDYIRLKNITASYTLPGLARRLSANNFSVFVQGNNLALWAKSKDIDPDNTGATGNNEAGYPQQRSYSLGIKVDF